MINYLFNLVKIPVNTFYYLYNWILFGITNTKCIEMPKVAGILIRSGKGKLIIGKNCKINSNLRSNPVGLHNRTAFYIGPNAEVIIGDNVGISNTLFYSIVKITVEDNVMIGGGCQFLDNDFHSLVYEERIFKGDKKVISKSIIIREGAFIGASTIILKGVIIGRRSVIGAGSVVTKNVPDNEIWAGNPAQFIKKVNGIIIH